MTSALTKAAARRLLRARRREISGSRDLAADAAALASSVVGQAPFAAATVLSYASLPHEPPTAALNEALRAAGHRVLLPITLEDMRLDWYDLADREQAPLGTDAPAGADLAIVPALAVDTAGTRLGQGGGCYDRVLPALPATAPVLVLLHPGEHTEEMLPREEHDVPVTTVATAAGVTDVARPL